MKNKFFTRQICAYAQICRLWQNGEIIMKKSFSSVMILIFVLIFVCVLSFAIFQDNEKKQNYFNATVLQIHEDSILVECLDVTNGVVSQGEEVEVSTNVVSANGVPELEMGDNIRIVCGEVTDSIPLSTEQVFAIYLLDADGNVIVPN
ncbi:MAG: hypothetical protein K2N89_07725 [Lachnospiraceae bacterium]|nr:hypothetical protein [Lachnospiraceae bacterium]